MNENQTYEKKSIRFLEKPDWNELAKDCVCFANAKGGIVLIGVEDDSDIPPVNQTIIIEHVDLIRKRINELTINVGLSVAIAPKLDDV